jgi:hypothetical protein
LTLSPQEEEEDDDRRIAAIALAIAAGVLRPCADHGDIVLFVKDADINDAYNFGNRLFKEPELKKFFTSRRQMTDAIKAVVVEHRNTRCPLCEPTPPH